MCCFGKNGHSFEASVKLIVTILPFILSSRLAFSFFFFFLLVCWNMCNVKPDQTKKLIKQKVFIFSRSLTCSYLYLHFKVIRMLICTIWSVVYNAMPSCTLTALAFLYLFTVCFFFSTDREKEEIMIVILYDYEVFYIRPWILYSVDSVLFSSIRKLCANVAVRDETVIWKTNLETWATAAYYCTV